MALAPAGAEALPGDERFTSVCTPSHTAPDDPIVFPKVPGASHMHQFFGNPATNARSTPRKLRRRPNTTCNLAGDFSGYWVPTLMIDGAAVAPNELRVYYSAKGRDPSTIEEIPKNLMMLAGDAHPTGSQAPWIATWGCTSTALFFVNNYVPTPSCAIGSALVLAIFFPDCWDGTNLDSADHQSHVAYAISKPFSSALMPGVAPGPDPGDLLHPHLPDHRRGVGNRALLGRNQIGARGLHERLAAGGAAGEDRRMHPQRARLPATAEPGSG